MSHRSRHVLPGAIAPRTFYLEPEPELEPKCFPGAGAVENFQDSASLSPTKRHAKCRVDTYNAPDVIDEKPRGRGVRSDHLLTLLLDVIFNFILVLSGLAIRGLFSIGL